MADLRKRVAKNVDGEFFVDSTCINCDTCRQLAPRKFEEVGGIRYIFLTHRDDVAEASKYAEKFGSRRIIHEQDKDAQPGAEVLVKNGQALELEPGFQIIPTPGHTEGHCVLLYKNKY